MPSTTETKTIALLWGPQCAPGSLAALRSQLPPGTDLRVAQADDTRALAQWLRENPLENGGQVLLLADHARLPEQAVARLTQAAGTLPGQCLRALDHDLLAAPADLSDAELDRACWLYGPRRAAPGYPFQPNCALLPAERLRAWSRGSAIDCVVLDHLWVGSSVRTMDAGDTDPRWAPPGDALSSLRTALARLRDSGKRAEALIGLDPRPVVLHVTHGWGGGTERWLRDLCAADSARHHLVLVARGHYSRRRYGERHALYAGDLDAPPLREWVLPAAISSVRDHDDDYASLIAQIRREFRVDSVTVSSLIGHSLDVLRTGLPTQVVCHDQFGLWPMLHRDFGDPALDFDRAQLERELAAAGEAFEFAERDPEHWLSLRTHYVDALRSAGSVLTAPSEHARKVWLRIAPELAGCRFEVIPHGLRPWLKPAPEWTAPERKRLRIVVPGRIGRGKGGALLRAALPRLREHAEVFLVGCGADGMQFFGQSGVHVLLDYQRDELPGLIATLKPDLALLPSTVAETFSYTLSEMWSLGLPVVATRVGALGERVRDGVDGFLIEPEPAALADCIQSLADDRKRLAACRNEIELRHEPDLAAMARAHAALIPVVHTAAFQGPARQTLDDARIQDLAARISRTEEALALSRASLETQRSELQRRADWATHWERAFNERSAWAKTLEAEITRLRDAIEALRGEFDDRTAWAFSLDARRIELEQQVAHIESLRAQTFDSLQAQIELTRARERDIQDLMNTRSWRWTAPLRRATTRARRARAWLRFQIQRVRSLGSRVRGSIARRGLFGTFTRAFGELKPSRPPQVMLPIPDITQPFEPFAVPGSESPRVSVIIPVYNHFNHTLTCLRSLRDRRADVPFEVIVVDDCSSDETAERLPQIAGLRVHRNAQNLGFIGACNAGSELARGEFVVFLNNDTAVGEHWLDHLVQALERDPQAGLVGAKLVYPDGRLQEAGGIVFNDASGWNYGRFGDPADARHDYLREVDYCSGAAIMLRRELFERLGRFDSYYAPAYYEDTDLAFKVRAAGSKVLYVPRAEVVHFEGVSSGTDLSSGTKRYQVVNQQKFRERWAEVLATHPSPPPKDPIERSREHRTRGRVLIIDACTPTPDQDSGSVRMVNMLRILREMGYAITFFADNRAWMPGYTQALQDLGVEVLFHPWLGDPASFFAEQGATFSAILLSRHYIASKYVDLARTHAPRARLIFDTVDLHYLREQRAAEVEGKPELLRQSERTRREELELMRRSDVTLVVSPVERDLLARELPSARVEILSNVHPVPGARAGFEDRSGLFFVGGFQHQPNVDAVKYFCAEILPLVHARHPEIGFHVVGSRMPDEIRALEAPGIRMHGFVEDIDPFLDGCRLAVAPLRYGAGVKGKVNMSMSYGQPVVATPIAVEGMHVEPGQDVLVAESPQDFADAIIAAYSNPELWQRLSTHGADNVRRHFSFEAARSAFEQILNS